MSIGSYDIDKDLVGHTGLQRPTLQSGRTLGDYTHFHLSLLAECDIIDKNSYIIFSDRKTNYRKGTTACVNRRTILLLSALI